MKSSFPRPLVNLVKSVYIPHLRKKWKKHPLVKEWVDNNLIDDSEIDWLVLNWQRHNFPKPPPSKVKRIMIQETGKAHNCKYIVETGTYMGDTIESQINNFQKIYSIELNHEFWASARDRFSSDKKVTLIQGDSGVELPKLVKDLDKKTLFWLDGHYCGGSTAKSEIECPIYEELGCIFRTNINHVIMIDDARMFNGTRDYPTLDELEKYIQKEQPKYKMTIDNDVIFVLPENN